jgi:hypothetical protein
LILKYAFSFFLSRLPLPLFLCLFLLPLVLFLSSGNQVTETRPSPLYYGWRVEDGAPLYTSYLTGCIKGV